MCCLKDPPFLPEIDHHKLSLKCKEREIGPVSRSKIFLGLSNLFTGAKTYIGIAYEVATYAGGWMLLSNPNVSFWQTMAIMSRPLAYIRVQIEASLTKFVPSKRSPSPY